MKNKGDGHMTSNSKNISNLCKLVLDGFGLPVFFINQKGDVIFEHLNSQSLNPLYNNDKKYIFKAMNFDPKTAFSFPVIRKTDFLEKYLTISVLNNDILEGTVLIGPFISYAVSEERINSIINDARLFSSRDQMFNYYNSLPNIKHEALVNISIIIFHMFNRILLSFETVTKNNNNLITPTEIKKEANMLISQNLQTNIIQHDRQFEKKILDIVREGRVEDLDNFRIMKEEEEASVLSNSSHMRSVKNHIITLITLVSIASIDGGLDHEIAMLLRDEFILQLEELNRIDETRRLSRTMLYTFTEKVLQVKDEQYSQTIASCRNYIVKRVYEEINHNDIASMIDLSPKYLSVLFKKEVGITISEYIQQTKIEEAKKLLAHSSNTILDISSLLNFSDQSYFTKVFRKFAGITPKVYRERHHLLK